MLVGDSILDRLTLSDCSMQGRMEIGCDSS